jgi:hypothetical protein
MGSPPRGGAEPGDDVHQALVKTGLAGDDVHQALAKGTR